MALSNIAGFDDFPFAPEQRGDICVVGAVFAGLRLEGVLRGAVERDGEDAAEELVRLVRTSKYIEHLQLIMIQGIALAGFNVVDIRWLHQRLGLPVLVIARRAPDLAAIRTALLTRVPRGERKWALIQDAGPMEPVAGVYIQRVGLTLTEAETVIRRFAVHSRIPEPLRTAHLIASGIGRGQSGRRV